jgi:antirestriction protein ArdC
MLITAPNKEKSMSPTEIRASITKSIMESLNHGVIPWRKPWVSIDGPRTATNWVTQKPYSGINVIITFLAEHQNRYPVSYWATFNQFRKINCRVKKGEKGTRIVYYSQLTKEVEGKNGDMETRIIPILKSWSIFNVAQVEGEAVERFNSGPELKTFEEVDRSEFDTVVSATNATIEHGFEYAAYLGAEDKIVLPVAGRFDSFEDYAATTFHELAHWCQPSRRLGIEGTYAENELFAELASSYLMAAVGIPYPDDLRNTKAYIQNWLRAFEDNSKVLFEAASRASRATDYILGFSRPELLVENEKVEEKLEEAF